MHLLPTIDKNEPCIIIHVTKLNFALRSSYNHIVSISYKLALQLPTEESSLLQFFFVIRQYTGKSFSKEVKPELWSTVLSGHPFLSGWLPKSRLCFPLITVIFLQVPTVRLYYLPPVLSDHLKPNHSNKTKNNLPGNFSSMFLSQTQ